MYVGDTTREEYEEYVTDCSYYGFDVDYDKGENYYRAYNEDGYYLSLSYEGNNIMLIRIDEPQKGAEAAAGTENVTEETAKQEVPQSQKPKNSSLPWIQILLLSERMECVKILKRQWTAMRHL